MITSPEAVSAVWTERHYPLISSALAELAQASQGKKRPLLESLIRLIGQAFKFYANTLNDTLPGLDELIPVERVVSTLKLRPKSERRAPIEDEIAVHIVHKCVIYIADLSRYRTHAAKTYMPQGPLSKADNNNYSKSIELYKLALLILPSHGDPYNHIAIIDNAKNDKFNVVYNFIRASMTSVPLSVAYSNLMNLISKQPLQNSILKRFLQCNEFNRVNITKNDRMELLRSQFLVLFAYYLLPSLWSQPNSERLVSGHDINSVETDFYHIMSKLDFHKQIFNDFYFKQIVILVGGFELLIDDALNKSNQLDHSSPVIEQYLKFIMRFIDTFLRAISYQWDTYIDANKSTNMAFSTSLLPSLRLVVNWLNARSLPRAYINHLKDIQFLLAGIINRIYDLFESHIDDMDQLYAYAGVERPELEKKDQLLHLLHTKPHRTRLFKEDVITREFKPVGYVLADFDDEKLYVKNENAVMALIGESNSIDKSNDNFLRLLGIVVMAKHVIKETTLEWGSETGIIGRYVVQNVDSSKYLTNGVTNGTTMTSVATFSSKNANNNRNEKKDRKSRDKSKQRSQGKSNPRQKGQVQSQSQTPSHFQPQLRPQAQPQAEAQCATKLSKKVATTEQSSVSTYAGASFSNFDSKLPQSIKMPLTREETKDAAFANMVASIVEDRDGPIPNSSGSSTQNTNDNNSIPALQSWYSSNGIWSTQANSEWQAPLPIVPQMMNMGGMPNMMNMRDVPHMMNMGGMPGMNMMTYYASSHPPPQPQSHHSASPVSPTPRDHLQQRGTLNDIIQYDTNQ